MLMRAVDVTALVNNFLSFEIHNAAENRFQNFIIIVGIYSIANDYSQNYVFSAQDYTPHFNLLD